MFNLRRAEDRNGLRQALIADGVADDAFIFDAYFRFHFRNR